MSHLTLCFDELFGEVSAEETSAIQVDKMFAKITSQRLLDQSQAGVYRGKRHIPPHFGLFGAIRVPYPKGLNC